MDGTINKHSQKTLETGRARLSFFGFDRFDSGEKVTDAFQIRSTKHVTLKDPDPAWSDGRLRLRLRLRLRFDTLQLYRNGLPKVTTPYNFGNRGNKLEPFTEAYPEYGKGGARQLIPKQGEIIDIEANEITILPEE